MIRRRLAVTLAVLAAVVGEWLGHSLNYYRVAGVAGLQAGLTTGMHAYMLPLGLALFIAAAIGAAAWAHAWLALSRRLDHSARVVRQVLRGQRPSGRGQVGYPAEEARRRVLGTRAPAPSFAARTIALAVPMAAVQCSLYLVQENLERTLHGISGSDLAPLLNSYGAAAWIQAAIAVALAAALVAAAHLLRSRHMLLEHYERLVGVLWRRAERNTSSPRPRRSHVLASALIFRSTSWGRPPPVLAPS